MTISRISVLGGGAWGTALAQTCARAGRDVTLWEFDAGNAEHLASQRESRYLPGVKLQASIKVTRTLAEAAQAEAILLVVPAQAMRSGSCTFIRQHRPRRHWRSMKPIAPGNRSSRGTNLGIRAFYSREIDGGCFNRPKPLAPLKIKG